MAYSLLVVWVTGLVKDYSSMLKTQVSMYLILHDIRSAENVGSIFRTADAAGIEKIYLTGYTPAPYDQFNRKNSKIAKTALGAEITIPYEKSESINLLLKQLKKEKVQIIALEQDPKAVDYKKYRVNPEIKSVLILGNEVQGVSKDILKHCDEIIEIPMKGEKESLNVAVATGVALFRIMNI